MSLESEITDLVTATTDLLETVNTKKAVLDDAVDAAEEAALVAQQNAQDAYNFSRNYVNLVLMGF